jgi:hypothetical protein
LFQDLTGERRRTFLFRALSRQERASPLYFPRRHAAEIRLDDAITRLVDRAGGNSFPHSWSARDAMIGLRCVGNVRCR